MIEFVDGDFFEFDADVRVNTVNCVGVMGAGVALAFKNRYPEMFKEYAKLCKEKKIKPGKPSVWKEGDMFSKGLEIINFPTKDHWRNPSEYEYVESGLVWLASYLKDRKGVTVTLPALGCGHGGLDWNKVKSLIVKYLGSTQNHVLVFEPRASRKAGVNPNLSKDDVAVLKDFGVSVLSKNSPCYPGGLARYTERDLYILGDRNSDFDISIISSSSPGDQEKKIVMEIIEYCRRRNLRVLFGGSAFDKRMALYSLEKGVRAGIFLPSGIFKSAEKMALRGGGGGVSIFSIGDPFNDFDRKEYMPSVLSRIFIGRCVFFTTNNLLWLKKQSKEFVGGSVESCFIKYEGLGDEDYFAAKGIGSKPIEISSDGSILNDLVFPHRRHSVSR